MSSDNHAWSVSRIPIQLEFDKNFVINGEIIRFYAPITISKLLKIMPIQNKVHQNIDRFVYIETSLIVGSEKPRSNFLKGDIAFLPANNSVCVFLKDVKYSSMILIGKITDKEKLDGVLKTDSLRISLVK